MAFGRPIMSIFKQFLNKKNVLGIQIYVKYFFYNFFVIKLQCSKACPSANEKLKDIPSKMPNIKHFAMTSRLNTAKLINRRGSTDCLFRKTHYNSS